jgi:predicted nuclease of predicted toxin-antitoxin system
MMRFLADENFSKRIVRAIQRETDNTDIVRVQDIGLYGADDPTILERAAQEGRILLSHDVSTIPDLPMSVLQQASLCWEL